MPRRPPSRPARSRPAATSRLERLSSTESQQRSLWSGLSSSVEPPAAGPWCTCRTRAGSAAGSGSPRAGRRATVAAPRSPAAARDAGGRAGDRAEQSPGVGVLGVVEDLVERPLLDDPPGVHHRDPVGDVGHHAEVVGHEDHGGLGLLCAAGGCARGSGPGWSRRARWWARPRSGSFGSQESAMRDHHALAHAARELERVASRSARRPAGSRPARAARSRARGPARRAAASCSWICSMICVPIF